MSTPKAEGADILGLIDKVKEGDIKIPKFQRNFVWKESEIIELVDSLYRGYPIGSLIFWNTKIKFQDERNIGGYCLKNTPENYPTNYVLDGQQRLTTIFSVFANRKNYYGIDSKYNISFDYNTETFTSESKSSAESIPLHSLLDLDTYDELTLELDISIRKRLSKLRDSLMKYQVPTITISNLDIEEVATIFERINSTGKKLTIFDLMTAATWSEEFHLSEEFDNLKQLLERFNYDSLSNSSFLKCMAVVMNGKLDRKSIFLMRNYNSYELHKGLEDTKNGLFKAIDFLTNELYVKSGEFLPYEFQIVLLTYFFSKVDSPNINMLNELKRWFWRSSFSERYQGINNSIVDKDLSDFNRIIDNDFEDVFTFDFKCSKNKLIKAEFKKGAAFSKAMISLLAMQSPRNLLSGTNINTLKTLYSFNRKEFHHVFPTSYLKVKNINNSANSICNIVFLSSNENKKVFNKDPKQYFELIKNNLESNYSEVLKSNLLPADDNSGIWENDYDKFINSRAELIFDKINELI